MPTATQFDGVEHEMLWTMETSLGRSPRDQVAPPSRVVATKPGPRRVFPPTRHSRAVGQDRDEGPYRPVGDPRLIHVDPESEVVRISGLVVSERPATMQWPPEHDS